MEPECEPSLADVPKLATDDLATALPPIPFFDESFLAPREVGRDKPDKDNEQEQQEKEKDKEREKDQKKEKENEHEEAKEGQDTEKKNYKNAKRQLIELMLETIDPDATYKRIKKGEEKSSGDRDAGMVQQRTPVAMLTQIFKCIQAFQPSPSSPPLATSAFLQDSKEAQEMKETKETKETKESKEGKELVPLMDSDAPATQKTQRDMEKDDSTPSIRQKDQQKLRDVIAALLAIVPLVVRTRPFSPLPPLPPTPFSPFPPVSPPTAFSPFPSSLFPLLFDQKDATRTPDAKEAKESKQDKEAKEAKDAKEAKEENDEAWLAKQPRDSHTRTASTTSTAAQLLNTAGTMKSNPPVKSVESPMGEGRVARLGQRAENTMIAKSNAPAIPAKHPHRMERHAAAKNNLVHASGRAFEQKKVKENKTRPEEKDTETETEEETDETEDETDDETKEEETKGKEEQEKFKKREDKPKETVTTFAGEGSKGEDDDQDSDVVQVSSSACTRWDTNVLLFFSAVQTLFLFYIALYFSKRC